MRPAWAILLLCFLAETAAAQYSVVAGEIRDSEGRPVAEAAVLLDDLSGSRSGAVTDSIGTFAFLSVRPGTYAVTVSHVGYESAHDTLTIGFDEHHLLRLTLRERTAPLDDVTVEEARGEPPPAPAPGAHRVNAAELARVPVPGPSGDLMGFLQTLPGAVRVGDSGGQLFVRGGTPTQNLVLVDGMPVYQPFHIVGFYSAFPSDIVSFADVYAGGFGARYGGRLSSVVDVTTRNGSKRGLSAMVSLAPFLSSARIEVPLQRDRISLMLSGRESVIERVGPAIAGGDFPFRFGDYFGKFHAFLTRTSSFSASALRTYDRGTFHSAGGERREISWRNGALGGQYVYLPDDFPVMTRLAVFVSRYDSDFESTSSRRVSTTTGVNGDIGFTYLLGANQLDFGIFGRSNGFDYAIGRTRAGGGSQNVTEGGGYLDLSWSAHPRLHIRTGLRAHAFSAGVRTALEPRMQVQVRPPGLFEGQVFGLAAGRYHQQILGLTALEDVTDVFIAWTPSPDQRPVPRATDLIGSWSRKIGTSTAVRVEGYVKWLKNLASPRYDRVTDTLLRIEGLEGIARGVDLRIERASEHVYIVATYALAEVRYEGLVPWPGAAAAGTIGQVEFHPPHDRRHQVNLVAEYRRGPYRFGALWQFGSGQPFSQILGFHPRIELERPDGSFQTDPGATTVAMAEPFGGRTPSYHRLDVSAERRFMIGTTQVAVQAGVVNAYDRKNLFDYDVLTGERVDQLPFIPYLGLRFAVN